ncbi:hypothetical protein CL633_00245, partial [bacterium]|nr:hypothetical protein [bacterium]
GTDTHLILIDLRDLNMLGNTSAEALEFANIITNRSSIPYDKNPPFYPSGLRLGTPGPTSRGMGSREMKLIGKWIASILAEVAEIKIFMNISNEQEKKEKIRKKIINNSKIIIKIKKQVKVLCKKFSIKKRGE